MFIKIGAAVREFVRQHGFAVNEDKTHIQHARKGFRRITGVMVGPDKVQVPKRTRRLARAIAHRERVKTLEAFEKGWDARQVITKRSKGILEWSKLKVPAQKAFESQSQTPAVSRVLSV